MISPFLSYSERRQPRPRQSPQLDRDQGRRDFGGPWDPGRGAPPAQGVNRCAL